MLKKLITSLCVGVILFLFISSVPLVLANGEWKTVDDKTYLYIDNKLATGWQTLNGRKYFFDNSGVLMTQFGIDVSRYQGTIDWEKVKNDGVEFAIIRTGARGWGTGKLIFDKKFENNIKGAMAQGINCGVYFYTQAIDEEEAIEEANFVLESLKKVKITPEKLTYPVFFDIEDPEVGKKARTYKLNTKQRTDICIAFSETIKKAGFVPMIYSSKGWFKNKLDTPLLSEQYGIWLAHWTKQTNYEGEYKLWQYSEKGKVDGIKGKVDMNVSFLLAQPPQESYILLISIISACVILLTASALFINVKFIRKKKKAKKRKVFTKKLRKTA